MSQLKEREHLLVLGYNTTFLVLCFPIVVSSFQPLEQKCARDKESGSFP